MLLGYLWRVGYPGVHGRVVEGVVFLVWSMVLFDTCMVGLWVHLDGRHQVA